MVKRQQAHKADDCAAAAAVDFECLEPAAAQGQEKPLKGLSAIATVIVDADTEEDTPETWDTLPEMTFYMPALYMPPLLSKALVALLHLVTSLAMCVIAIAVGPFGSVALLLWPCPAPASSTSTGGGTRPLMRPLASCPLMARFALEVSI
jgi:hypothetical protein